MTVIDKITNLILFVLVAMLAVAHVIKGSMWHFGGPGVIIVAGMGLMRWAKFTIKDLSDTDD